MDYTYPSVYFSYFFFLIVACGALYFFFRSRRDGYWGEEGEEVKYKMLNDDELGSQRSPDDRHIRR